MARVDGLQLDQGDPVIEAKMGVRERQAGEGEGRLRVVRERECESLVAEHECLGGHGHAYGERRFAGVGCFSPSVMARQTRMAPMLHGA